MVIDIIRLNEKCAKGSCYFCRKLIEKGITSTQFSVLKRTFFGFQKRKNIKHSWLSHRKTMLLFIRFLLGAWVNNMYLQLDFTAKIDPFHLTVFSRSNVIFKELNIKAKGAATAFVLLVLSFSSPFPFLSFLFLL